MLCRELSNLDLAGIKANFRTWKVNTNGFPRGVNNPRALKRTEHMPIIAATFGFCKIKKIHKINALKSYE